MKKIILLLLPFFCVPMGFSSGWEAGATYRGSSDFYQLSASIRKQLFLSISAGLEARFTDEKVFKDPIYSVYVPLEWENDVMKFLVRPFYYFENKSHEAGYQDASAFGVKTRLIITLQQDNVDDVSTHAYIGASFARQEGTLFTKGGTSSNQSYMQTVYTLGLHKNFFNVFSFELFGNGFQYPDGITGVAGFRGILDQGDLTDTPSLDLTHELGKYTIGARLTRMWTNRPATLYLGYRFGEFYSAEPEHSFLLGNTFAVANNIHADLAYNHLRTIHNHNKRDVFYVRLRFLF